MKIVFWIIIFFLASLIVVVIYYPLSFDLQENYKAKQMVDYILIPVFGLILLYSSYSAIKSNGVTIKEFCFYHLFFIAIMGLLYYSIFRPFLSNGLICINYFFGKQKEIKIEGLITNKTVIVGGGKMIGKYELTVESDNEQYIFDSNLYTLEKFNIGEMFNLNMKTGLLNLLYVKL